MVTVDERIPRLSLGYVVFRYPQLSETFISDEIGELVRQGVEVRVFTLESQGPTAGPAPFAAVGVPVYGLALPKFLLGKLVRSIRVIPWIWRNPIGLATTARLAATSGRKVAWLNFIQAARLAARLRRYPARLIHAGFASEPATVAMLAATLVRVPFTFSAHAVDIFVDPVLMRPKLERAANVRVISEYNRGYLARHFGANGKIRVVPCGVIPERFKVTRRGYGREFELLSVCRLVPKKGLAHALAAVRNLRDRGVPVRYTIAGDGPLEAELRERTSSLRLGDTVTFVGPVPPAKVAGLLSRAAAFVLPCVRASDGNMDGLPVAILEAMAAGVPVVSTLISGIPEAVKPEAGLLIPAEDERALTRALLDVYDDWLHGAQRFCGGPGIVEKEFRLRTNVAAWRAVMEGVVG